MLSEFQCDTAHSGESCHWDITHLSVAFVGGVADRLRHCGIDPSGSGIVVVEDVVEVGSKNNLLQSEDALCIDGVAHIDVGLRECVERAVLAFCVVKILTADIVCVPCGVETTEVLIDETVEYCRRRVSECGVVVVYTHCIALPIFDVFVEVLYLV